MKFFSFLVAFSSAKVWHGENDIASFKNTAGIAGTQNTALSNLFDDSIYSFFMSNHNLNNDPEKHLLVTFNEAINFQAVSLHKRVTMGGDEDGTIISPQQNCCYAGTSTFNNVCLVLDGDIENQMCTDAPWGWSYDDWQT